MDFKIGPDKERYDWKCLHTAVKEKDGVWTHSFPYAGVMYDAIRLEVDRP